MRRVRFPGRYAASQKEDQMRDQAHIPQELPIQPEIPRSRFALGQARYPRDLETLRLGQFSDGQRTHATFTAEQHRGRFSQGQELLGDKDPEKHIRRRFSEGMETPSTK
jgi:hypothetical protein